MTFNICNLGSKYPYFNRAWSSDKHYINESTLRQYFESIDLFFEKSLILCINFHVKISHNAKIASRRNKPKRLGIWP